jgi:hypothetical protein
VIRTTDKINLNATKEEWFNRVPNTDGGEEWINEFRMRWDTGRHGGGIAHPPAVLRQYRLQTVQTVDSTDCRQYRLQTVQTADKKIKREMKRKRKQLFNLTLAAYGE